MDSKGSLPYSLVPATCPYPEPTPSSLHPLPLFLLRDTSLETSPPPPGDPSRGVVRIVLSPEEASRLVNIS